MLFMGLKVGELFYVLNSSGAVASDALYEKILTRTFNGPIDEKVLPGVSMFKEANARVVKSRNIEGSQNENVDGYLNFILLNISVLPHNKTN